MHGRRNPALHSPSAPQLSLLLEPLRSGALVSLIRKSLTWKTVFRRGLLAACSLPMSWHHLFVTK